MANNSDESDDITVQGVFRNLSILLLCASLFGQVFFGFLFPNSVYSPGTGEVINFQDVVFQICGLLVCIGLFLTSVLILIALRLEKLMAVK
jgi:hypothetical protein